MKKKKDAFTLVELLVVIAIIGVLAGLLLPAIGNARRQAARSECMNNLKQIGLACRSYASDYNGLYPVGALGSDALKALVTTKYMDNNKAFYCPENPTLMYRFDKDGLTEFASSASPLASDAQLPGGLPTHPGNTPYNVLYCDGHVGKTTSVPTKVDA